jgi:hypothetical protein
MFVHVALIFVGVESKTSALAVLSKRMPWEQLENNLGLIWALGAYLSLFLLIAGIGVGCWVGQGKKG